MKIYSKPPPTDLILIQFGGKKSVSFTETTVQEVLNKFLDIFSKLDIERTVTLKGSPLDSPKKSGAITVQVRHYRSGIPRKGGRSRQVYGLTSEEACKLFKDNL